MAEKLQVYKCEICGHVIMVMHKGMGQFVCCNQPMTHLVENTVDAAREKHVPVMEKAGDAHKIKVGSVAHPMEEKHYIEWIQLIADDKLCTVFLEPGGMPEISFNVQAKNVTPREYCNLHGLWKG